MKNELMLPEIIGSEVIEAKFLGTYFGGWEYDNSNECFAFFFDGGRMIDVWITRDGVAIDSMPKSITISLSDPNLIPKTRGILKTVMHKIINANKEIQKSRAFPGPND